MISLVTTYTQITMKTDHDPLAYSEVIGGIFVLSRTMVNLNSTPLRDYYQHLIEDVYFKDNLF